MLVPVCILRSRAVCVVSSRTWGSCPPFRVWSSHRSFRSKPGSWFLLYFQDSLSQPGPGHKVLTESGGDSPSLPQNLGPSKPPTGFALGPLPSGGGRSWTLHIAVLPAPPSPLSRSQGFYEEIRQYFYYVCKFPVLYWGRKLFDTNHSGNFIKCTCFEMEVQVTGDPNQLPPGHGVAVAPAAFRKGVSPCVVRSSPSDPGRRECQARTLPAPPGSQLQVLHSEVGVTTYLCTDRPVLRWELLAAAEAQTVCPSGHGEATTFVLSVHTVLLLDLNSTVSYLFSKNQSCTGPSAAVPGRLPRSVRPESSATHPMPLPPSGAQLTRLSVDVAKGLPRHRSRAMSELWL